MTYQDKILFILRGCSAGASVWKIARELVERFNLRKGRDYLDSIKSEAGSVSIALDVLQMNGRVHCIDGIWSLSGAEEAGDVHAEQNAAPGAKHHGQSAAPVSPSPDESGSGTIVIGADLTNEGWSYLATEIIIGRFRMLGHEETLEILAAGREAEPSPSATEPDRKDAAVSEPTAKPAKLLSCAAAARLQALAHELSEGQSFSAADALALATLAERGSVDGLGEASLSVSGR